MKIQDKKLLMKNKEKHLKSQLDDESLYSSSAYFDRELRYGKEMEIKGLFKKDLEDFSFIKEGIKDLHNFRKKEINISLNSETLNIWGNIEKEVKKENLKLYKQNTSLNKNILSKILKVFSFLEPKFAYTSISFAMLVLGLYFLNNKYNPNTSANSFLNILATSLYKEENNIAILEPKLTSNILAEKEIQSFKLDSSQTQDETKLDSRKLKLVVGSLEESKNSNNFNFEHWVSFQMESSPVLDFNQENKEQALLAKNISTSNGTASGGFRIDGIDIEKIESDKSLQLVSSIGKKSFPLIWLKNNE